MKRNFCKIIQVGMLIACICFVNSVCFWVYAFDYLQTASTYEVIEVKVHGSRSIKKSPYSNIQTKVNTIMDNVLDREQSVREYGYRSFENLLNTNPKSANVIIPSLLDSSKDTMKMKRYIAVMLIGQVMRQHSEVITTKNIQQVVLRLQDILINDKDFRVQARSFHVLKYLIENPNLKLYFDSSTIKELVQLVNHKNLRGKMVGKTLLFKVAQQSVNNAVEIALYIGEALGQNYTPKKKDLIELLSYINSVLSFNSTQNLH